MSPLAFSGVAPRFLAGVAALVALAVAPLLLPGYLVGVVVLGFVYAVFALSVDLVWGYAGVLTFGHAVFFGLGAYLTAVALPGSLLLGVAGSVVLSGGLAVAVAAPLFRRGVGAEYFAIITLALAVIATRVARSFDGLTGGSNGLLVPAVDLALPGLRIGLSGAPLYYATLGALVGAYLLARRVVESPLGRAAVGAASNERKAHALGHDVARHRAAVFGLSGGLAGVAGALYALQSGLVTPSTLGFELSTLVLVWVLVGGRGTLIGPAAGAVGLTLFETLLGGVFVFWWTLLLGLTIVAVVVVAPGGMAGLVRRLGAWRDRSTARAGGDRP